MTPSTKALQAVRGSYKGSQKVTRGYRGLKEVRRLQGVKRA